ncbi:ATP-grasp domain-containing protein [Streptomyces sp. ISL-94]|uniref:ATP-grasp domain-containing protein n=1 Tax=Streptomyces sp. ISL-94 TaxID=2819190 RepID=UPI001BE64600|nr:ATP-grasp domain-containing protein [Streptomyces sp. ISL-94]MBT2480146.1 ATP-grasp domain-containing protein [Streptomyces sp. ISL-94]
MTEHPLRPTDAPALLLVGGAAAGGHGADSTRRTIRAAHALGLAVHLTDLPEALAAAPAITALADRVSALDHERPETCARWARSGAAGNVRAVFSSREYAQEGAAALADALGLPGNDPAVVATVRRKDRCRVALAAAGFRQPAVRLCHDLGQAREFAAGRPGPWIVKPRDAMGSLGVALVETPGSLDGAVAGLPDAGPFLIEEYVSGPEFSVEGVLTGGRPIVLAVTAKHVTPPPLFVELAHALPAPVAPEVHRGLAQEAAAAVTALGLRHGVFHVEGWWTSDGPVLGEVHTRFGGDWIHLMLEHVVDADVSNAVLRDLLGLPVPDLTPPDPAAPGRGAAVLFPTPPPGTVEALHGWDRIAGLPGVLHADPQLAPGDTVPPLTDSAARRGVLVTAAEDARSALDLARHLSAGLGTTLVP